ncbi:putative DNA primase/helicase [Gracilibacillus ureilyticus]|uniref:Putative DNA primase/helicase n=1 Tax=Gracilibacillus ureilyticus TaxID=531814 RepID=A0A1H9LE31_9BACI|nr:DNA primase family protein [Gracilibacillus ureilyticus]SER09203.1 putative DNA primase/helicase [Gracilibacillus ureilyticus]
MENTEYLRINPFGGWEIKGNNYEIPIKSEVVKRKYPEEYEKQIANGHNKDFLWETILTKEDYQNKDQVFQQYVEKWKPKLEKELHNNIEKSIHNEKGTKESYEISNNKNEINYKGNKWDVKNFFSKEKNKFLPSKLGQAINEEKHTFFDGSTLYFYENGVYLPNGEPKINNAIQRILKDESSSHRKREVIDWIKTNNDIRTSSIKVNPDDGWINVKNGLLNLETRELKAHTHKRVSTVQLPITYDPKANNSIVSDFIGSIVHNETIPLIYEMIGYILTNDTKAQKAFILHSSGGSGKSVVVSMLQAFVGKGNYSTVPAQDIDGDKFSAIRLKDKVLNIVDDMKRQRFADTGKFKSSVTGGEILVEEKGKPQEIIKPIAKHIFCMNAIPDSSDMSVAWLDRWIMIPLPYRFRGGKGEDKDLPEKLTTEKSLSTLLNVALNGLDRLRSNNYRFSENEHTEKMKNDHMKESNPIELFVDEICQLKDDAEIIGDILFKSYKTYCEENGYRPLSKIKFNKQIRNTYDLENPSDYRPRKNDRKPTWRGICFI